MDMQIGFGGLGSMGQAISKRLVEHGNLQRPLLLFNRTHEVAKSHAESLGLPTAIKSFPDLVEHADIIWNCFLDDDAVREIYAELQHVSLKGKLFVESSTLSAETIDELSVQLSEAGADLIAMPFFGEPSAAAAGRLVVVPAGPAASIDRIRPLLDGVTASSIIDFPDDVPRKACELKFIGNVLIMTTIEQIAELLVFAEKAQVGSDAVERLLSALYPGGPRQHSKYASLMVSGDYHRRKAIVSTTVAINLSEKITSLAKSLDVQLKSYEVAIEHLKQAREAAGPDSDIIGIYGAVRQSNGLCFQN